MYPNLHAVHKGPHGTLSPVQPDMHRHAQTCIHMHTQPGAARHTISPVQPGTNMHRGTLPAQTQAWLQEKIIHRRVIHAREVGAGGRR